MHIITAARRVAAKVGWALIAVAAIVGLTTAGLQLGVRTGAIATFHVTTWSMQPTIDAGDLIISRPTPAADVKIGDIITIPDDNSAGYTTHRVVEIEPGPTPEARTVTLKGDANEDVDAQPYEITETLVQRVTLPKVGGLLDFVSTPPTSYYLLLMFGALLVLTFLTGKSDEDETSDDEGEDEAPAPAAEDSATAADDASTEPEPLPRPERPLRPWTTMAPKWKKVSASTQDQGIAIAVEEERPAPVTVPQPEPTPDEPERAQAPELWRVPEDDPASRLVPAPFELVEASTGG